MVKPLELLIEPDLEAMIGSETTITHQTFDRIEKIWKHTSLKKKLHKQDFETIVLFPLLCICIECDMVHKDEKICIHSSSIHLFLFLHFWEKVTNRP